MKKIFSGFGKKNDKDKKDTNSVSTSTPPSNITTSMPLNNTNNMQKERDIKTTVKIISEENVTKEYMLPNQMTVNELRKLSPLDNHNDYIMFHPSHGVVLTPYFQLKNLKTKDNELELELLPPNQLPESKEITTNFTFTNKEEFSAKIKVYKTTILEGLLFLLRLQHPQFMAVKWENALFKDSQSNPILLNDNVFEKDVINAVEHTNVTTFAIIVHYVEESAKKTIYFAKEKVEISNIFEECVKHFPSKAESFEEYGIYAPSKGKWVDTGAPVYLFITSLTDTTFEFRKKTEQEISQGLEKGTTENKEEDNSDTEKVEDTEEKRELLYKFKRDQLGLKLESDYNEEEENKEKNNTPKRGQKVKPVSVNKKDKELVDLQNICNNLKKYLKRRPPTAELGQATNEKGKLITAEELEPTYLDYEVIEYCTTILEKIDGALDTEGIYRISGDSIYVKYMWSSFVLGNINFLESPDLSSFNPNIITGALKLYLRELKDPLIPFECYERFINAIRESNNVENIVPVFKEIVQSLDPIVQHSLYCLCKHLKVVVTHEEENKMNYENVSIVFGPTTMRPRVETMDTMMDNPLKCQVVSILVQHYETIFVDLKELPPKGSRSLAPIDPKKLKTKEKNKVSLVMKKTNQKKGSNNDSLGNIEEQEEQDDSSSGEEKAKKKDKRVDIKKVKNKISAKNYGEIMSAFDTEEVNGAIMIFLNKYDEDPKAFSKYVSKNQSSDHLLNIIVKLSRKIHSEHTDKKKVSSPRNEDKILENTEGSPNKEN